MEYDCNIIYKYMQVINPRKFTSSSCFVAFYAPFSSHSSHTSH